MQNTIQVYYARPVTDFFPTYDDFSEEWMVDTANYFNKNGCINDQGLYDSLLAEGLSTSMCDKVFELAENEGINLDSAECIWGEWTLTNKVNKTSSGAFNDLNNALKTNNIPVEFICHWTF